MQQPTKPASPLNHSSQPLAPIVLVGDRSGTSTVIGKGAEARRAFLQVVEEWKLLTAAMLNGIAHQATTLAAEYAKDRTQFGRPIGSFQGVAHPLADRIADIEGAQLLLWSAIAEVSRKTENAGAEISRAYWWSAIAAGEATRRALHTFGGYGLTNEYDIQLYIRRAKALSLQMGDPIEELVRVGKRAWLGEATELPDAGATTVEFSLGTEAQAFGSELRAFLESYLTKEWHAKSHYSYLGHDWQLHRALGTGKLLYPTWQKEFGGRELNRYSDMAGQEVYDSLDVTTHAIATTNIVGRVIECFGSEEVKAKYLAKIGAGEMIASLGYTEPHTGSDVFAARTRALRDGDNWTINGQKMFTSGANLASIVLLLTRSHSEGAKHDGITLFIVPLDSPGVDIRPISTWQEEPTNATFYTDVRVPDSHRIGPTDGGAQVLAWALSLEQGGAGFYGHHLRVLESAVSWARGTRRGTRLAIEDSGVLGRLARVSVHQRISALLSYRCAWLLEQEIADRAAGPMSKVFSSETFWKDSNDLMDLTGPASLVRGKHDAGYIELHARHASGTTVLGGTSEVHRSQVAEKALGLPRSR
jgi:alkylation response protein AidB-like acyl-CoA dehydrogenase